MFQILSPAGSEAIVWRQSGTPHVPATSPRPVWGVTVASDSARVAYPPLQSGAAGVVINATPGNAVADGALASILTASGLLVDGIPGNAVADGAAAQIIFGVVINATVGNAVAAGPAAGITSGAPPTERPPGGYTPRQVPTDPAALQVFLTQEFRNIANAFSGSFPYAWLAPQYAEPAKPRDGWLVKADGVLWDPGSGAGVYEYEAGTWHKLRN